MLQQASGATTIAPMNIEEAKKRLPLPALMRLLGIPSVSIPTQDGQSARCPWYYHHSNGDKKPSFNIYQGGSLAKCFGCGYHLDAPGFLAKWKGCSQSEACREFIRLAEGHKVALLRAPVIQLPRTRRLPCPIADLPMSPLTDEQVMQIARVRVISPEAISWACQLGVLKFGYVCGHKCWVLLDDSKLIAEARRLDDLEFPAVGGLGARKAHTLKGTTKSWPVGAALLDKYSGVQVVMLVEGGPDYLAALHFILLSQKRHVLPIAMLGAEAGRAGIDPRALASLRNRDVRLYPHIDLKLQGLKAAHAWAEQLRRAGCRTDLYPLAGLRRSNGIPVKDLNDLTTLLPEDLSKIQNLIP